MCTFRNQSLLIELKQYRKDYVAIPQQEQTQAKDVVQRIKQELHLYSRSEETPPQFNFGQIFHQGSMYEGLKVIKADEFDLLVPLNLDSQDWAITSSSEQGTSGYYMMTKIKHGEIPMWDELTDNNGRLIPTKVRDKMQSIVRRAVNEMKQKEDIHFRIHLSCTGPAVTIHVCYDKDKNLSIDIVPSVRLKNRSFVAKCPKRSSGTPTSSLYDRMWRESFSEDEKKTINKIDKMNECRRDCLKILKTIQKYRESSKLGILSSYHLKTCLLHLNKERPDLKWEQDDLADRFKDLLDRLKKFLDDGNMQNFFDSSVDLFDRYNTDSLRERLGKCIKNDESIINKLLHGRDENEDNFEIFVLNTNDKTTTYGNMKRSTTIKQLKVEISKKEGIPVDQQRLVFKSRPTQDSQTLGYYGIEQGSTIHLFLRLKGG